MSRSETSSELLSVVAWMQIVGAGFGLLVALLQFGLAGVIWATAAPPTLDSNPAASGWPICGVGCFFLAVSILLALAGIGLRRRYHWARQLSIGLCYFGAFLSVAFFCLEYVAVSGLFHTVPGALGNETVVLLGTVLKAFFGGITLASTGLLVWVAHRLRSAALLQLFAPIGSPAEPS